MGFAARSGGRDHRRRVCRRWPAPEAIGEQPTTPLPRRLNTHTACQRALTGMFFSRRMARSISRSWLRLWQLGLGWRRTCFSTAGAIGWRVAGSPRRGVSARSSCLNRARGQSAALLVTRRLAMPWRPEPMRPIGACWSTHCSSPPWHRCPPPTHTVMPFAMVLSQHITIMWT